MGAAADCPLQTAYTSNKSAQRKNNARHDTIVSVRWLPAFNIYCVRLTRLLGNWQICNRRRRNGTVHWRGVWSHTALNYFLHDKHQLGNTTSPIHLIFQYPLKFIFLPPGRGSKSSSQEPFKSLSRLGVDEICKWKRDVHAHLRTEVGAPEEKCRKGRDSRQRENLVHRYPAAADEHKPRKNTDFKKRFWCCVHFSRCLYPHY